LVVYIFEAEFGCRVTEDHAHLFRTTWDFTELLYLAGMMWTCSLQEPCGSPLRCSEYMSLDLMLYNCDGALVPAKEAPTLCKRELAMSKLLNVPLLGTQVFSASHNTWPTKSSFTLLSPGDVMPQSEQSMTISSASSDGKSLL
jgi:hypothetical protein